jgi:hypothetical protein
MLLNPVKKSIEKFRKSESDTVAAYFSLTNFRRGGHDGMIPLKSGVTILSQIDLATVDFDVPSITGFAVERFWNVVMHERVSGKRGATGADRMTRKWPLRGPLISDTISDKPLLSKLNLT